MEWGRMEWGGVEWSRYSLPSSTPIYLPHCLGPEASRRSWRCHPSLIRLPTIVSQLGPLVIALNFSHSLQLTASLPITPPLHCPTAWAPLVSCFS